MSKFTEEFKKDTEEIKQRIRAVKPSRWIFLSIMIVITVLSFVFYDYLFSPDPKVNIFLDPSTVEYDPETGEVIKEATSYADSMFINQAILYVPMIIKSIQSITIVWTISTIIVFAIGMAFKKNQREITVSALIRSMINWLTAIIIVIVALSNFGVNTTALITGAGVLTLVVGLGMQSLIADVVAGLFIVFENQFNVGDIITVDGFRGEVVEIGIRTTKLKALGNIKIFNNNSIQGVLNQSREPSVAKTLIDVEYGDRIPEIEKIIKAHVSELNVPGALSPISYDGVAGLGASGVTLQFTCQCNETDIFAVGRELNAAIKNMFDENGIGIPFPQIVVHHEDK